MSEEPLLDKHERVDIGRKEVSGQEEALANYEKLRELYVEPSDTRKFIYDMMLWFFRMVFDCFFREIRPRGAFRLPKSGPVIFVAAPHANQFVDPMVLLLQVKQELNRRVSFLIAEKSHKRRFIGLISRTQLAIPVKRAQDNLKLAHGTVTMDPDDPLHVIGHDTLFHEDCESKGLLALPKSIGVGQVDRIVSDTELYLRKPFRYTNDKTREKGEKLFAEGTPFKTADKVDQSVVYAQVFEHLARGHCLGVFSEGGSHDRPDLLPLKAGVAIMALGAMDANPGIKVKIVPCGMNYFHPHKFRSRAVVEFGYPIEIGQELVDKYADPATTKEAVKELLDTITRALKSVTVTCPDFDTLMVIQTARRLYSNSMSSQLSLPAIVEMNRRLLKGYMRFKDEPRVKALRDEILDYNLNLRSLHIPDHLVESPKERSKVSTLIELISTIVKVAVLGTLALPGGTLFAPIFFLAKKISEKKRKEALAGSTVKIEARDVIATWKILVSMGLAPLLYTSYSVLGSYLLRKYWDSSLSAIGAFVVFYALSATVTYSALVFGDRGNDLIRSIRPLWLMLVDNQGFARLQEQRSMLAKGITEAVNEYGPQIYPNFKLTESDMRAEPVNFDSDEEEEKKTRQIRNRRKQRKNKVTDMSKIADVPILPDDDNASSNGLSSSSTSDFELVSDEEGDKNTVNLVRDQVIQDHRDKNE